MTGETLPQRLATKEAQFVPILDAAYPAKPGIKSAQLFVRINTLRGFSSPSSYTAACCALLGGWADWTVEGRFKHRAGPHTYLWERRTEKHLCDGRERAAVNP